MLVSNIVDISGLEDAAISKYPRRGKCSKSVFACGWHRCGTVPMYSLLDGGCPGDVAHEVCLECGTVFNKSWFIPKAQPREIKVAQKPAHNSGITFTSSMALATA